MKSSVDGELREVQSLPHCGRQGLEKRRNDLKHYCELLMRAYGKRYWKK